MITAFKKNINFIGKQSLLKIKDKKIKKKLLNFSFVNSSPGKPLLMHDEPILYKGKIVGRTTSGNYSFNFKKNLAFGYLNLDSIENYKNENFQIEVEKIKYNVLVEPRSLFDSKNSYLKS